MFTQFFPLLVAGVATRKSRAAEINAKFEEIVTMGRAGTGFDE